MLGVARPQIDAILPAHACQLLATLLKHLRGDIHTNHLCTRSRSAQNRDGEICRTGAQIKPRLSSTQGQVTSRAIAPVAVQPKAHQAVHHIVYTRDATKETLYIGALAPCRAKSF